VTKPIACCFALNPFATIRPSIIAVTESWRVGKAQDKLFQELHFAKRARL
jgi:hypothetical protein